MSSFLRTQRTIVSATGHKHTQPNTHTISGTEARKYAFHICPHGTVFKTKCSGDLLVFLALENQFHNSGLPGWKTQFTHDIFALLGRERRNGSIAGGRLLAIHHGRPQKKKSVEPRTLSEPRPGAYRTCPGRRPLRGAGTRHCFCI